MNPVNWPPLTIIHGPRDAGKTRSARGLAERCARWGRSVGGILSLAEMVDGQKVSYRYLDLGSAREELYAKRRGGPVPPGQLGFQFLEEGLAFGAAAIREAARRGVDVLIVDEVGPLEVQGQGLWQAVRQLPRCHAGRLVITVRSSLVEDLVARLRTEAPDDAREPWMPALLSPEEADRLLEPTP
jgi:nucleoside-triphosphatase THEP1